MSSQATDSSGTNDSTKNNPSSANREAKEITKENANEASSTSSSTPQLVNTPSAASSVAGTEEDQEVDAVIVAKKEMADKAGKLPSGTAEARSSTEETKTKDVVEKKKDAKKNVEKGKSKKKAVKKSKKRKDDSSDDDGSSSEDAESDSGSDSDSESSSSDESSEDEKIKRKKKSAKAIKKLLKEKAALKAALKSKNKKKSKKYDSSDSESSSDASSSDSDSDTDSEVERRRRKHKKSKRRRSKKDDSSSDDSSSSSEDEKENAKDKAKAAAEAAAKELVDAEEAKKKAAQIAAATEVATNMKAQVALLEAQIAANSATPPDAKKDDKKASKKGKLEFKRVDEVWDNKLRNWAIKTTSDEKTDEFDCVFAIRRKFDWEGKHHEYTLLDIKSKALRESLQEVLKDVKGVSLVEDNPSIDPHMMFLHHPELKAYIKELKTKLKKLSKKSSKNAKKETKKLAERAKHCKLLSAYLDEDYKETRRKLRPMLRAGNITYDLLWALFKPNTIAFTPTYGVADDPRCFKVDSAYEQSTFFGDFYSIQGQYLEYDGKAFGMGDFGVKIDKFKGVKKISSLDTYPLEYVKKSEEVREQLITRGKKFVTLQGMSYRQMKGLAFFKKKKGVGKVNINGRVMIDPAIFRRINPNYYISSLHKHQDDEDEDEEEEGGCGCEEEEEEEEVDQQETADQTPEFKYKFYKNKKDGKWYVVRVPILDGGPDVTDEQLDDLPDRKRKKSDPNESSFTEEDLLIASPVVLGFAFSEKLWLEFSLSGINDIQWNDTAFDSLVLPQTTKQNLRGLVSSHRFNAAKTIDDVIQGKGKGLNVVLHGPPGVGKTLTAESIAEYLKAPLYAVSAGELGTNSRAIEIELNRIMDITHSWGAILLLDEADVFLEQRAANDVHRNALVSVFLRLLEYYQGILFLTTNRVSTFDEAFQSRIHMGIRYENLTSKARLEIWKAYIKKVRTKMETEVPGKEGKEFKESDLIELSKKNLNGRQIKNACTTAQSIALAEKGEWGIEFVKRVLDVQEDFEQDLRGGSGYRDAMRQYT